jgi:hypothetical protein
VAGANGKTGRTVFGRVIDGMGVVDTIAAVATSTQTAKDGTSLPNVPTDTITVTIRQIDGNGATIPPAGSQQPTIACPPAVDVEATGDLTTVSLGEATATDAAGAALTPTNDAPADGFPMGTTTVTWKATDSAGRVATCAQSVTVTGPLITTASGLQYQDLVIGTGPQPPDSTASVTVNYVGTLEDGTQFDASNGATFALDGVIPGFAEGVQSMHVGGKRKLIIPPDLGYGADGSPPKIPANATLIFVVDLVDIPG